MRRDRSDIGAERKRLLPVLALVAAALLAGPAVAQPQPGGGMPNPRLMTVTPTGGKIGTVVEMTFTGTDLEEPQGLLFSHPSIKAEPIIPPPPMPDPKQPPPNPAPKPIITRFKVTVGADTPLGNHDVRLVSKWGVSNPRVFVVGDLLEVLEKEPNNDVADAQRVELNSTVSGAITAPTDVDYYVFAGKKDQRVVVSCLTSSIDSRSRPALEVYDSKGKQLAANRHYHRNDALVDCTLPADGDYYVRLYEFTHTQGSAEYFYRVSITTAPWIDAVYPPVVEPGKEVKLTVYGRNLPDGKPDSAAVTPDGRVLEKITVTVKVPNDPAVLQRLAYSGQIHTTTSLLNGFEYRVKNASGSSNPFLLTFAKAPVVLDNEANDTVDTAQEVNLPCEIAGWFEKKRDRDWYAFTAKKGEVYTIEVLSECLGSPTDLYMVLRNAATKQDILDGSNAADDNNDPVRLNPKFFARTDDPAIYRFVVPADGKYQLMVANRHGDHTAGPRYFYRVRITTEMPDFHVIVMPQDSFRPDSCQLAQGGNQLYTVYLWRMDGFNGEVTLTAEGLPKGVTCPSQVLGAGLRQASLVVSAAPDAPAWAGEIKIKATATIQGKPVVREARPASITWPVQPGQGVPTISRIDRGVALAVRDQAPYVLSASIDKPVLIQGDKANLSVKLARLWPDFKGAVQVTAIPQPLPGQQGSDLPAGLTVNNNQPFALAADKNEGTLVVTVGPNVTPGTYNLVLRGTAPVPFNKDALVKQKQPINMQQPANALTITVLPKTVATVAATVPNPNAKVGTDVEVTVKVTRQYEYAGEFKVQLILPPNVTGISAGEVTIPAGKDEAKLVVKVAADASPGPRNDLVVRATAVLVGNVATVQETKFNLNVVK